jgi:hypothetical protein
MILWIKGFFKIKDKSWAGQKFLPVFIGKVAESLSKIYDVR